MTPGFWMVRCCMRCPPVAARIWLCQHEPGEPENLVEMPYLQGQLGLDLTDPAQIWEMVAFCEATPAERARLTDPPLSERAPRGNRSAALQWAPIAKWKRDRARRIIAAEYDRQITWLRWAERHQPAHPEFNFRKPVELAQLPLPRF